MVKIPLSEGSQTFMVQLGDLYVQITLTYRKATYGGWFLDIETTDGETVLNGVPLVCGVDLFEQYGYKGLGSLYCLVDGKYTTNPTYEDMGSTIELYWEA
jgi:hypothetical protein